MAKSKLPALKAKPFIIEDETDRDKIYAPVIDGEPKGHGLVPRDPAKFPYAMFAPPSEIKPYPRSEWDARFEEQEKEQSSLQHIRRRALDGKPIPSQDQNGHGYCWAYGGVGGIKLMRARDGLPYVDLNAHMVAAVIKNGRDEGGWCGLSAKFLREVGVCSTANWKKHSRDTKQFNDACKAEAALYKVTEDYVDIGANVYDQNLTVDQIATCLFNNVPVQVDYNEWGHSIIALRWYRVEKGSWAPLIWNSWTDGWGDLGEGVIRTSWDVDGAVAQRVTGL